MPKPLDSDIVTCGCGARVSGQEECPGCGGSPCKFCGGRVSSDYCCGCGGDKCGTCGVRGCPIEDDEDRARAGGRTQMATAGIIDRAQELIAVHLDKHPVAFGADCWVPWVDGNYTHLDFCRPCARAVAGSIRRYLGRSGRGDEVSDVFVDGGWGSESDGPAFCAVCSLPLGVALTDYAADEEIDLILTDGAPADSLGLEWAARALDTIVDDGERRSLNARKAAALVVAALETP